MGAPSIDGHINPDIWLCRASVAKHKASADIGDCRRVRNLGGRLQGVVSGVLLEHGGIVGGMQLRGCAVGGTLRGRL